MLTNDVVPGASTVVVKGELRQFFVEPKSNFFYLNVEADVGVLLEVSSPSGLVAKRNFCKKGLHSSMASTDSTFQDAADDAAYETIRSMVIAITELLNQYPALGTPSATSRAAVSR